MKLVDFLSSNENVINKLVNKEKTDIESLKHIFVGKPELHEKLINKFPKLASIQDDDNPDKLITELKKQVDDMIPNAFKMFLDDVIFSFKEKDLSSEEIKTIKEESKRIINLPQGDKDRENLILSLRYLGKSKNNQNLNPANISIGTNAVFNKLLGRHFTEFNKHLVAKSTEWINEMKNAHPDFKLDKLITTDSSEKAFEYTDPESGYKFILETNPYKALEQSMGLKNFSCLAVNDFNAHYLWGNVGNINLPLLNIYSPDNKLSHRELFTVNPNGISAKPVYNYTDTKLDLEITKRCMAEFAKDLGLNIDEKMIDTKKVIQTRTPSYPDSLPYHDADILQCPTKK